MIWETLNNNLNDCNSWGKGGVRVLTTVMSAVKVIMYIKQESKRLFNVSVSLKSGISLNDDYEKKRFCEPESRHSTELIRKYGETHILNIF